MISPNGKFTFQNKQERENSDFVGGEGKRISPISSSRKVDWDGMPKASDIIWQDAMFRLILLDQSPSSPHVFYLPPVCMDEAKIFLVLKHYFCKDVNVSIFSTLWLR